MTQLPLWEPDDLPHGRDAYVTRDVLRDVVKTGHAARWWTWAGQIRSAQVRAPHKGMLKASEAWTVSDDPETGESAEGKVLGAVEEGYARGLRMPGSWSSLFWDRWRGAMPRLRVTPHAIFASHISGGWAAALERGRHAGTWHVYDIHRAYYWALSTGLPDLSTLRLRSTLPGEHSEHRRGLYVVRLARTNPTHPYPFSRPRAWHVAALDEIEHYGLEIEEVVTGVEWSALRAYPEWCDWIESFAARKPIGRAYWGRWASRGTLRCHSMSRPDPWELPVPGRNSIWAQWIVSRVRRRLWEATQTYRVVHVHTDSVLTSDTIPTGDEPGDWQLERSYEDSVYVQAAGSYGRGPGQLDRHQGAPANSPNTRRVK